jgi:hypothetical protein
MAFFSYLTSQIIRLLQYTFTETDGEESKEGEIRPSKLGFFNRVWSSQSKAAHRVWKVVILQSQAA